MSARVVRNVLLSCLSGIGILGITWFYQNYDFSFSVEDSFMKKLMTAKYNYFHLQGDSTASFLFLNTGKDLALVSDTTEWGNVAVSDRKVILDLMNSIQAMKEKPRYTVLDIQFYYPFTPDPAVDTLLGKVLAQTPGLVIPEVPDAAGVYHKPLFDAPTGYAGFNQYGVNFAKFRIVSPGALKSLPVVMDEALNHRHYESHGWYATCNGRLCLRSIWPGYVLNNDLVTSAARPGLALYYEMGEFLQALKGDPESFKNIFKDRILIVGNFGEDVHPTPVGKMAGSVMVANIYLSLLNGQQMVSYGFFVMLFLAFTGLSYLAWFSKMPEINIRAKFLASYLTKFVRSYISYFGSMVLLSLLSVWLFHIQVALFVPSFIFSWIEYFQHKKFRVEKNNLRVPLTMPQPS